ncbi:hypothetical protein QEN19_002057 [Hanseniaspora menglaensis]
MMVNQQKNSSDKRSPGKKRANSSNTSAGKINTHGLLLNKIVFSPPKDEDHYREMDINENVLSVRSNHNVITNQPIANTKSYENEQGGNDEYAEYAVLEDLENGSVVKDDEFTSDQKFAPILKMNNTGKLTFFTKLQQVQPSLVPAASITGKVQFKSLNTNGGEQLSMMQEEKEGEIFSSPQQPVYGQEPVNNNNLLKRKANIMEIDDVEEEDVSNHSIRLGSGLKKMNFNFDMSDSEDSSNHNNPGIANILKQKFNLQHDESGNSNLNKDDFGQISNNKSGDISIDAIVRGTQHQDLSSPDKRTSGDGNKNKFESPLKNISINLNESSDLSGISTQKKNLNNKLGLNSLSGSLLDRNSSKFLRLSPSGNKQNFANKENQIHHQIMPSSPSIQSSRKKLKLLPKLPPNHLNSPLLNVKMMSPMPKGTSHLDLDMSSSVKSSRNNSPSRSHNISSRLSAKSFNRVAKTQGVTNSPDSRSSYLEIQRDEINNLVSIVTHMQKNFAKYSKLEQSNDESQNFKILKQNYDREIEAKMRLDTQNEQLSARVIKLEKDLLESANKMTKLESQLLNKNQREVEMENKFTELEKTSAEKVKDLQEKIDSLTKINLDAIENLKQIDVKNVEKLNLISKERDELLIDVQSKNDLISNLNKTVSNFDKVQEENLTKLSTDLYQQYSKKHEDKLNHMKQSYTQALNSLKKLVHSLRDEITKKNEEINKLKTQLSSSTQTSTRRTNLHR